MPRCCPCGRAAEFGPADQVIGADGGVGDGPIGQRLLSNGFCGIRGHVPKDADRGGLHRPRDAIRIRTARPTRGTTAATGLCGKTQTPDTEDQYGNS